MNIWGFRMIVKDKVFHSSSIIIHTYCHLEIASRFCGRNLFSSLHGARGIAEFTLTELTENALGYICQCRVLHLVRLVVLPGNVIFPSYKHIKIGNTASCRLQFQLRHFSSTSSWSVPYSTHTAACLTITLPTPTRLFLIARI